MSLAQLLTTEFTDRRVMAENFPMLTRAGIPDIDVTIHSHFISYLAVLGQAFGYSGVVECPLLSATDARLAKLGDVRSDVVWFDKQSIAPVAAFEFERFDRGNEAALRWKVENLNIAYLQSDKRLQVAVLIYWVRSGQAPATLRETTQSYHTGFVRNGILIPVTGCPLYIFKCTWRAVADRLAVSNILSVEVP